MSNEKSANYGNVMYKGVEINHQWSKSLEFEKMFQEYIHDYISSSLEYFSLLRPWSELRIVQEFVKYPKYFHVFSSCNNNFKVYEKSETNQQKKWCGHCPKCAFVFSLLSAFLTKEQLQGIFGKNLYADEALIPLYKELLGIKDFKPFECVGTPEEVKVAMYMAHEKGEYKNDIVMKMFEKEIVPTIRNFENMKTEVLSNGNGSNIPDEF
jgi:hypothetical protein